LNDDIYRNLQIDFRMNIFYGNVSENVRADAGDHVADNEHRSTKPF